PKGTVVLLNFWDFGCPSCNQEVKHLERLQQKYGKQGFRVIGVAGVDADAPKVKQFLRQHEATYPVALDPRQTVAKKYGVTEHPATVIIDRQGVVRFVHTGFLKGDEKTLEAAVRATLEGGKLAMTE
ncbi:MAG: TlpA family protein disulfide reductase, partial [Armatimonadetes bacterium]|nr:TlpA family protein disulfide reductase [Armatimonadota bacterium]